MTLPQRCHWGVVHWAKQILHPLKRVQNDNWGGNNIYLNAVIASGDEAEAWQSVTIVQDGDKNLAF